MLVKVNSILDELDRVWGWSHANDFYPPTNIAENDDQFTVEMRVPGLLREDLSIEVEDKTLIVRGEIKRPSEGTVVRQERTEGKFERTITFKHTLNIDLVQADLIHGILRVTLPKSEEAKPRKITINPA